MDDASSVNVRINFDQRTDPPLFKSKFDIFNSGIVSIEHYQRDLEFFQRTRPHTLRIDVGWGSEWMEWSREMVSGTASSPEIDFSSLDEFARLLLTTGCRPYLSYCYMPEPLQPAPGEWKRSPKDLQAWANLLERVAGHYREKLGPGAVIHEIYNEPDNDDFFLDSMEDYFEMYRYGAPAIRRQDPDGQIGGPALASALSWAKPFLEFVTANDLPLDFFSFHFYGKTGYDGLTLPELIGRLREIAAKYQNTLELEFHLNEFNSYEIDYPKGGRQDRHPAAADLLDDFYYLLTETDLAKVHWAQFLDSGKGNFSGMVSIEGFPKAVYHAYEIYSRLPVDRRALNSSDASAVNGMASTDGERAGAVLWNRTAEEIEVQVALDNLPFQGRYQVYRIDSAHSSWGDGVKANALDPVETVAVDGAKTAWRGRIPGKGVVYFELEKPQRVQPESGASPGNIVRTLHYYPRRGTAGYAELEPLTWRAYLGTGKNEGETARVACIVDQPADALNVDVSFDPFEPGNDADLLIALRVDYQTQGGYQKTVLYPVAGERLPQSDPSPWGLKESIDRIDKVDHPQSFLVRIKEDAPAHWTGRVILSFVMNNRGSFGRARFAIRSADRF